MINENDTLMNKEIIEKNKVILIDLDDTLVDKDLARENTILSLAETLKMSVEKTESLEKEYLGSLIDSGKYHYRELIKFVGNRCGIEIDADKFMVNNAEKIYSGAVFPEVKGTLDELTRKGYKLGIFSQGYLDFQKIKINSSGILEYLDKDLIQINENKLNDEYLKSIPDNTIIIDDKKKVVERLRDENRFRVIWINRKDEEKMDGVETVKDLKEMVKIIEK